MKKVLVLLLMAFVTHGSFSQCMINQLKHMSRVPKHSLIMKKSVPGKPEQFIAGCKKLDNEFYSWTLDFKWFKDFHLMSTEEMREQPLSLLFVLHPSWPKQRLDLLKSTITPLIDEILPEESNENKNKECELLLSVAGQMRDDILKELIDSGHCAMQYVDTKYIE